MVSGNSGGGALDGQVWQRVQMSATPMQIHTELTVATIETKTRTRLNSTKAEAAFTVSFFSDLFV